MTQPLRQGFVYLVAIIDWYSRYVLSLRLSKEIAISMDGRGRVFDNIFTERLWRSMKYEEVYIKDYQVCRDAREGLEAYFSFYNNRRYHQAMEYKTPYEVHYGVSCGNK